MSTLAIRLDPDAVDFTIDAAALHFVLAEGRETSVPFLDHVMEVRGLTRKDLEANLRPRGQVSDIMNRTRPMTLDMIRRLADGLGLPADAPIKPYPLRRKDEDRVAA